MDKLDLNIENNIIFIDEYHNLSLNNLENDNVNLNEKQKNKLCTPF